MNTQTTKAGDVVFAGGNKYKLTSEIEWSEFHQSYYAPGFRWVKTKQKFSGVDALHMIGPHFEIVD